MKKPLNKTPAPLVVHGQKIPGDDLYIVGTTTSLRSLASDIAKILSRMEGDELVVSTIESYTHLGEGYNLVLVAVPEQRSGELTHLSDPYLETSSAGKHPSELFSA